MTELLNSMNLLRLYIIFPELERWIYDIIFNCFKVVPCLYQKFILFQTKVSYLVSTGTQCGTIKGRKKLFIIFLKGINIKKKSFD